MRRVTSPLGEAALFFALTLGVSYLLWLPLAAAGVPAGSFVGGEHGPAWALVMFLLGGFVPSGVALTLTAAREGKAGMREIGRRLVRFRIGWRWYLAVVGLVVLPAAAQIAIIRLLGNPFDLSLFLIQLPSALPLIVIGPLSEEIGWRGYALDRLQSRFGPLISGLSIGIVWGFWHLPLFLIVGTSQHDLRLPFVGFLFGVTALSLLFTWLYNNTRRSIWTAVFFHWVYTYAAQVIATGTTRSPAYNWLELTPYTVTALLVLAITGLKRKPAPEPAD